MGDGEDNILHDLRQQVREGLDEMGVKDDHFAVYKKYDVGQSDGQVADVCVQDGQRRGMLLFNQLYKLINILQGFLQMEVDLVQKVLV